MGGRTPVKSGIYLFTNTISQKHYVGKSVELGERKTTHLCALRSGYHHNRYLQAAWDKHGEAAFTYAVLQYCDEADLLEWEDWWMEQLDSRNPSRGYNLRSAEHYRHSEESKARIAATSKGKVVTPESRVRMSAAQKSRVRKPHSEEAKARISAAAKGKTRTPHSPEHKANLSAALKGKPWSEARREAERGREVPCVTTV